MWKNNGTITVGTAAFEMNDGYLAAGKLKASKALTISVKDGVISGDRLDSPEISIECHDGLVRGTLAGTQEEYGWQASVRRRNSGDWGSAQLEFSGKGPGQREDWSFPSMTERRK